MQQSSNKGATEMQQRCNEGATAGATEVLQRCNRDVTAMLKGPLRNSGPADEDKSVLWRSCILKAQGVVGNPKYQVNSIKLYSLSVYSVI
jgi:hypothetical protein